MGPQTGSKVKMAAHSNDTESGFHDALGLWRNLDVLDHRAKAGSKQHTLSSGNYRGIKWTMKRPTARMLGYVKWLTGSPKF